MWSTIQIFGLPHSVSFNFYIVAYGLTCEYFKICSMHVCVSAPIPIVTICMYIFRLFNGEFPRPGDNKKMFDVIGELC